MSVSESMDVNSRFAKKIIDPAAKWSQWKEEQAGKSTPVLYDGAINYFLRHNDFQDLNELFETQKEADRRGASDPLSKYLVHDLVIKTVMHRINNEGISGSHAKFIKSAVVKFMRLCGFKDFRIVVERGVGKMNAKGGSDIISPQNLNVVIDCCDDPKKRALILFLKDSGLRLGDIISMNYGDIREALDSNQDFYQLKKFTEKTGARAQTVIGFEALNALRDYIRYRKRIGDNLYDSTPIFNRYKVSRGQKIARGSDLGSKAANIEANRVLKEQTRMNNNSAGTMLSNLFDKSGFPKVTAHGLRKLHSTYLGLGDHKVSEPMIARMEGRSIGDSREAYKIYPEEDLIEAYRKNYHQISLNKKRSQQEQAAQEEVKRLLDKIAILENNQLTPEMISFVRSGMRKAVQREELKQSQP